MFVLCSMSSLWAQKLKEPFLYEVRLAGETYVIAYILGILPKEKVPLRFFPDTIQGILNSKVTNLLIQKEIGHKDSLKEQIIRLVKSRNIPIDEVPGSPFWSSIMRNFQDNHLKQLGMILSGKSHAQCILEAYLNGDEDEVSDAIEETIKDTFEYEYLSYERNQFLAGEINKYLHQYSDDPSKLIFMPINIENLVLPIGSLLEHLQKAGFWINRVTR